MLTKIEYDLKFAKKRDFNIITPCCKKSNKDGKFVNYKNLPEQYGYCFSCGKITLPPSRYKDEKGNIYIWDEQQHKIIKDCITNYDSKKFNHTESPKKCKTKSNANPILSYKQPKKSKTIDFNVIKTSYNTPKPDNFKNFLFKKYNYNVVIKILQLYYIGTSNNNFTVFWYINKKLKAQKSKEVLYNPTGNRTDYFKVPYTNEDGYYFCLFGEHLLKNNTKPIILVESEKTAVICAIVLPKFTWLAYSGINGLTYDKLYALRGKEIIIIPDISNNALNIIKKKQKEFEYLNIDAEIYDLTEGKSDEELHKMNIYNDDIADLILT